MKILEAQSAVLTNYEVYTHLVQMKERYAKERKNKRGESIYCCYIRAYAEYTCP